MGYFTTVMKSWYPNSWMGFVNGTIRSRNGWELGVALWLRKPPDMALVFIKIKKNKLQVYIQIILLEMVPFLICTISFTKHEYRFRFPGDRPRWYVRTIDCSRSRGAINRGSKQKLSTGRPPCSWYRFHPGAFRMFPDHSPIDWRGPNKRWEKWERNATFCLIGCDMGRIYVQTHRIHVCHIWWHLPSIYPSHVSINLPYIRILWEMSCSREPTSREMEDAPEPPKKSWKKMALLRPPTGPW